MPRRKSLDSPHKIVLNTSSTAQRIVVHMLLAAFLANAANKFFVPDLEYEAAHSFYARIFAFEGDAPDQYRILPLLALKVLCGLLPFNSAVLVFNAVCSFLAFEVFHKLMRRIPARQALMANIGFAGLYIYMQYTGWRPDTMGLVLLTAGVVLLSERIRDRHMRDLALILGIIVLAFSRADLAFALAAFFSIYRAHSMIVRLLLPVLPVLVQAFLQFWAFPEAEYYTHTIMLLDNLSAYYLLRNPATYLLLALGLAFGPILISRLRWIWKHYTYFVWIFAGYLVLVLVIGRLNEFRVFLPFWPLFLVFWSEACNGNEKEAGTV